MNSPISLLLYAFLWCTATFRFSCFRHADDNDPPQRKYLQSTFLRAKGRPEMNASTISALATRLSVRPWTCSTCRSQLVRPRAPRYPSIIRSFASGKGQSQGGRAYGGRSRRILLYASSGTAAAGVSVAAFTDDIKSGYETVERSGRVATALASCINE